MQWKAFLPTGPARRRRPDPARALRDLDDHMLRDLGFVRDRCTPRPRIWPMGG